MYANLTVICINKFRAFFVRLMIRIIVLLILMFSFIYSPFFIKKMLTYTYIDHFALLKNGSWKNEPIKNSFEILDMKDPMRNPTCVFGKLFQRNFVPVRYSHK